MNRKIQDEIGKRVRLETNEIKAYYLKPLQDRLAALEGLYACLKNRHTPILNPQKPEQLMCSKCHEILGKIVPVNEVCKQPKN